MLREGRFGFILEMIRLNELFALLHIDCEDARILQGISDDTRDVKKDWLFVCRKGSLYDGAAFLQEALDKGAVVLCDQMLPMQHVYYTPHVERITQALLELYYGDLCTRLHVIGITEPMEKQGCQHHPSRWKMLVCRSAPSVISG